MVYLWALVAGLLFAVAAVLQHGEARAQPPELSLSLGLVRQLVRRPLWLLGNGADGAGVVAQAAALGAGSLFAVEAMKTSGILFALVLTRLIHGTPLRRGHVVAALVLAAGLATFLVVGAPVDGATAPTLREWITATVVTVAVVIAAVAGTRRAPPSLRSVGLGVATGATWALTAALLKHGIDVVGRDGWAVLATATPWVLVVTSVVGIVLNQSAFQAGDLAWSLPALSVSEPLLGAAFGALVFHERLAAHGWGQAATLAVSAGAALAAVWYLARPTATVEDATRQGHTPAR